jgi:hypothetical protein
MSLLYLHETLARDLRPRQNQLCDRDSTTTSRFWELSGQVDSCLSFYVFQVFLGTVHMYILSHKKQVYEMN